MAPAFGKLAVGQQVIGKTGMSIDMIRIDRQGAPVVNGGARVIAAVTDGVADVAQQVGIVRGGCQRAAIQRQRLVGAKCLCKNVPEIGGDILIGGGMIQCAPTSRTS